MRQLIYKNGSSEKLLSLQSKYHFVIKYAKYFHRDFQRKFANNQGKNILQLYCTLKSLSKNLFCDLIRLLCFVKILSWVAQVNKDIETKI